MLQEAEWQALTAVREGRVSLLAKDMFHYKPSARFADCYETLARIADNSKGE